MINKKLILVDGSSYLYRAFHAMPFLSSDDGMPTGAIYGVLNMLNSLQERYCVETADIVVVFDPKGKTVRHDWYPEYKANRSAMPADLVEQIQPVHELIKALGIPLFIVAKQEADDVIGTLARIAATEREVVIATSDKDMAQLVGGKITLLNTMTDLLLDRDGVKEKFGVYPEQIIDYLTLVGDSADNIPGVPRVGPKTAIKWLGEYGSISNCLKHRDELNSAAFKSLVSSEERLPLLEKLVTIDQYVVLEDFHLSSLQMQGPDYEKQQQLFKKFGFKKQLVQLKQQLPKKDVICDYRLVLCRDVFTQLLDDLAKAEVIALDTETDSLDVSVAKLVGISLSYKPNTAYYIPLGHDYDGVEEQLAADYVLNSLATVFASEKILVGQNIKYDYQILQRHGLVLPGLLYDTMLLSYVLNSSAGRHNMSALAERYLDCSVASFSDVAGSGKQQKTFNQIALAHALEYAAADADITLQLYYKLWPLLQNDNLADLYIKIEAPLIKILAEMELTGILLDSEKLIEQSARLKLEIASLNNDLYLLAGEEFNVASTKQLRHILFEKLALPVVKKTPTKQAATSEEVLTILSDDYEIARLLLQHRSLSKLKSTYTDRLPEQICSLSSRVHCSFNQAVTSTGRLSATEPNLQNIPIKNAEGRLIRQAFIAPPGKLLLSADYSQIELRIMAHLSNDENLLSSFAANEDIHSRTAAEIFAVPLAMVNQTQRRHAKAINFGLIYGMSAFGLAKQLGLPRAEAQDYIDCYFSRYPGVKQYMDSSVEFAQQQGYVETIYARKLYLPGIKDKNHIVKKAAQRAAINAPMQGSAADIIKLAMIDIAKKINNNNFAAKLLLQVHDELIFEVNAVAIDSFRQLVAASMESAANLSVPLSVSIGIGLNWDEAH